MRLRRLMLLLFMLTQVSVVAAVPATGAAVDAVNAEHCVAMDTAKAAESEAESGAEVAASHAECDDGCQLCAACAPGLAALLAPDAGFPTAEAAWFRAAAASVGVLTTLLRPPAIS